MDSHSIAIVFAAAPDVLPEQRAPLWKIPQRRRQPRCTQIALIQAEIKVSSPERNNRERKRAGKH